MWPTIERWSWLAGIVGALVGMITLIQARRDRRQAQQDWRTQTELQAALLEAVRRLAGEANPSSNTLEAQTSKPRAQEAPATLKRRADSLAKSAEELEKRAKRRLYIGSAFLGFALFAGAIAAFISPSTIDGPIAFLLTNTLAFTAHIGLPATASWVVGLIALGVIFGILTAPLQAHNVRDNRIMEAHAPQISRIQKKYKNDRQRQAQEMQRLQREHGFNPLGGLLRGLVILLMTLVTLPRIPNPQSQLKLFGAPLDPPTDPITAFVEGLPATIPLIALVVLARLRIHVRMRTRTDPLVVRVVHRWVQAAPPVWRWRQGSCLMDARHHLPAP